MLPQNGAQHQKKSQHCEDAVCRHMSKYVKVPFGRCLFGLKIHTTSLFFSLEGFSICPRQGPPPWLRFQALSDQNLESCYNQWSFAFLHNSEQAHQTFIPFNLKPASSIGFHPQQLAETSLKRTPCLSDPHPHPTNPPHTFEVPSPKELPAEPMPLGLQHRVHLP